MAPKAKRILFSVSIADCDIQTFTVGGPGGGGKDTSNTGVRLTHKPSGAVGECREERHQHVNKQRAFRSLVESPKFKTWHRAEVARRLGQKSIEDAVEEAMRPENLRFEVRDERGKWTVIDVRGIPQDGTPESGVRHQ
jgi:protein subunit release factor A